ncbi:MAG: VWA domain-containing protein [Proteobacteria bacterium]|nr:VWA domain-containing protein [Pseudomonadota bacterium]
MLLGFLIVLMLYLAIGAALYALETGTPRPGSSTLVRTVSRRWCREGEEFDVSLHFSTRDLPSTPPERTVPMEVVLVVDASASMGRGPGSPLAHACEAMASFVAHCGESVRVGVVSFAQVGHVIADLTEPGDELVRAIGSVIGGASTAIDEGLNAAGALVGHGPDADTAGAPGQGSSDASADSVARLIVLLSDGESHRGRALDAATRLKDADIRIAAISLGYSVNRSLLESIASDGLYFHCPHAADMAPLYRTLAKSLDQVFATEVNIEETYNESEAGYLLVSTGRAAPDRVDLKKSQLGWTAHYVGVQGVTVDYRLRAQCMGWHRVATRAATADYQDIEGKRHSGVACNRSPRVLVLPEWPIWPLWWALLNPLFWLVVRRIAPCDCEERWSVSDEVPPPAVEPPALPPLLEADRSERFELSLRPTLVVGVGYLGQWTVTHLEAAIMSRLGRVPDDIGLHRLDLAGNAYLADMEFAGVRPAVDSDNQAIAIGRDLYSELRQPSLSGRYSWLDVDRILARGCGSDVSFGARGDRQLAKLAMAVGYSGIAPRLSEWLQPFKGLEFDIVVVASSGGGASSGLLADLCYALRGQAIAIGGEGAGVTAMLLQSDDEPTARGNTQALLRELGRLAYPTGSGHRSDVDRNGAGIRRWLDRVLVVTRPGGDNAGQARATGRNANRFPDICAEAADAALLWMTSAEYRNAFAGLAGEEARESERIGQAVGHRIGIQSVRLPVREIDAVLAARAAMDLLGDRLLAAASDGLRFSCSPAARAVDQALAELVDGDQNSGVPPAILHALRELADAGQVTGALGRSRVNRFANMTDFELAGYHEQSHGSTVQWLQAWALRVLNGDLRDDELDDSDRVIRARRGRLAVLAGALDKAAEWTRRAERNILSVRSQTRSPMGSLEPEVDQAAALCRMLGQRLAGLRREVGRWEGMLVSGHVSDIRLFDEEYRFDGLCRILARDLAEAERVLDDRARTVRPVELVDRQMIEKTYRERYQDQRDSLLARFTWLVRADRDSGRLDIRLRLRTETDEEYSPQPQQVEQLRRRIDNLVRRLVSQTWRERVIDQLGDRKIPAPSIPFRRDGLSGTSRCELYLYDASDPEVRVFSEARARALQVARPTMISGTRSDPHWSALVTADLHVPLGEIFDRHRIGDIWPECHVHAPEALAAGLEAKMREHDVDATPVAAVVVDLLEHPARLRAFIEACARGTLSSARMASGDVWTLSHADAVYPLSKPGGSLVDAARQWIHHGTDKNGSPLPESSPEFLAARFGPLASRQAVAQLLECPALSSCGDQTWIRDLSRIAVALVAGPEPIRSSGVMKNAKS